jgi:cyclophilin family peptidyl-prolyl cis-trans isomerase
VRRALSTAALALGVLTLAACGGGDDGTATSASAATECADVEAPEPKPDGGQTKPTTKLDPVTTYVLVFETSCGDFEVTLDQEGAPETSASLVSLASAGFYDSTIVHRVVPGFVVQGGDPTGTGSGGPGYSTTDVPPDDASYTRGVVAMAKTELEPPGTAGSQWFVVTKGDAGLPPDYAIVGEVTSGSDTVQRIEALGDVTTQQPSQPVVVERVSVRES